MADADLLDLNWSELDWYGNGNLPPVIPAPLMEKTPRTRPLGFVSDPELLEYRSPPLVGDQEWMYKKDPTVVRCQWCDEDVMQVFLSFRSFRNHFSSAHATTMRCTLGDKSRLFDARGQLEVRKPRKQSKISVIYRYLTQTGYVSSFSLKSNK